MSEKEKAKASIYKNAEELDVLTNRTLRKKVLEVKGSSLKEVKEIFDEEWKIK